MAKNLSRLATKLLIRQFHKRTLSGSWSGLAAQSVFLNLNERDLLTLFQLAPFFLLVPWHQHTVNSFQTGETAKKKWFEEGGFGVSNM
jgi:hypothetical protein